MCSGKRAVVYKELIISNRGCIETPKKNASQVLEARIVTSVVFVFSELTGRLSKASIYGGSFIVICQPFGIDNFSSSLGIR